MKKFFILSVLLLILVVPAFVFAQGNAVPPSTDTYRGLFAPSNPNLIPTSNASSYANIQVCMGSGLTNLLCNIHKLLNAVIPVLLALGVVYFVWGVVQYVIADAEEAKKAGRDRIIYGIIGFTIIIGVWGLVTLVINTFGIGAQTISVPSLVPTSTAAQSGSDCTLVSSPKLQNLLGYVTCIIGNSIIPLMFALAIAFFIWGVIQFVILGAGEEAKRTQGRQHMIWGIIALAVMLGVWSLVGILGGTFGLNTRVLPQVQP